MPAHAVSLGALILACWHVPLAAAINNGLALTPPMGCVSGLLFHGMAVAQMGELSLHPPPPLRTRTPPQVRQLEYIRLPV